MAVSSNDPKRPPLLSFSFSPPTATAVDDDDDNDDDDGDDGDDDDDDDDDDDADEDGNGCKIDTMALLCLSIIMSQGLLTTSTGGLLPSSICGKTKSDRCAWPPAANVKRRARNSITLITRDPETTRPGAEPK